MSKLLNVALAAALGFALSTPLYAADTSQSSQANRSTAWSDAQVRTAMDKCNNLTKNARAKCIVNIRPTAAGDKVALSAGSSSDEHTVKDGTAAAEAEYSAAVKECESQNAADKDSCINTAKEHFGRM
jgi:hypothetical protein